MNNINIVVISGNLTRDPEQRFLQNGSSVCNFGLAVNRSWTQDGQKREEVTFLDTVAFGKTAEIVAQYCKKGHPVLVNGRLKLDQWNDKQTQQKRSKLSVVAESVTFLSSGRDTSNFSEHRQSPGPARAQPKHEEPPFANPESDDVPF